MAFQLSTYDKKRIISPTKKIIQQYNLIEAGDKIAVGLSGGKDSTTLLAILKQLQQQLPYQFDIVPISLSLGFEDMDILPMEQFVKKELKLPLYIVPTPIKEVLFDIRNEKNPCSLCANMRRGILYSKATELGCNKVALGHHLDDAIETYFMNMIFSGKLETFQPRTYLDRAEITLIRPFIAIEEQVIKRFVVTKQLPIIENPCPANKKTKREEMKRLVENLTQTYPDIRTKLLTAFKTSHTCKNWVNI